MTKMAAIVMEMLMRNLSDILVLDNAFGKENIIEPLLAGNGPTNSLGSSDAQKILPFLNILLQHIYRGMFHSGDR